MGKPIGLDLPQRRKPGRGDFDIRPRRAEAWVAQLPRANLGETARRLYTALTETNRLDLPFQDRARFLDTLLEPAGEVAQGLRRHFVGVCSPLPEKNRKVAAVARHLHAELATGYGIAAEDLLRRSLLLVDGRLLTQLLYRATALWGRVLLTDYETYSPHTRGAWAAVHRLFAFAESRRLHRTVVADPLVPGRRATLADEYKRILLLALASPYCLRHGEAGQVHRALERWAARAVLRPVRNPAQLDSPFGVDLDSDGPPRNLALAGGDCDPSRCRLLDTRGVLEVVRDEIMEADDVVATTLGGLSLEQADLPHPLLRRLMAMWSAQPRRHFSRSHRREQVEVALGLSSAHHLIAGAGRDQPGGRPRPDRYFKPARFEGGAATSGAGSVEDVWDRVYPAPESLEPSPAPETEPEAAAGAGTEPAVRAGLWQVVDEGAGGYCLESTGAAGPVQVGELAGIRRAHGHSWKWGVGVVRWLKFSQGGTLRMGVEMLTPDAAAAGVRVTAAPAGEASYQRTLMLPGIEAINRPATLVMPPVPFREGSRVTLRVLGREMQVRLTRQLENTGLFAQFQFELVTPRAAGDSGPPADSAPDDGGLDGVWSSI